MTLQDDDAKALELAVGRATAFAKQPLSLDNLLGPWRRFVASVERGYDDSIYEYANDLSTRTESARRTIMASLDEPDRRFYEATVETDRSICGAETR